MDSETTQMGAEETLSIEDRLEARFEASEAAMQEEPAEVGEPEASEELEIEAQAEVEGDDAVETSEDDEDAGDEEQIELGAEEIASILGVDEEQIAVGDDGSLKILTKIDGEVHEATLADLVKVHQLEGTVNAKSMELAEARKAFEERAAQKAQAVQEQMTQAEYLLNNLEQQVLGEYQAVDWAKLRQENPAEFAAKQQEYGLQYQQLQQSKQQVAELAQQQQQIAAQEFEANRLEMLQREGEALIKAIPEWKDEAVAAKGKAEIRDFMHSRGFGDEDLAQLVDHRAVLLIRDAMKATAQEKQVNTAKKKVKRVPKVIKPGAATSKAAKKTANDAEMMRRFKKGDEAALDALLESRM